MPRVARFCWIVTIVYWIALFAATHVPAFRLPPVPVTDKTGHFVAYALLAIGLTLALRLGGPPRPDAEIKVIAILLAYGAFDELTQILVNRSCEMADWYADAAGAATGALLAWFAIQATLKRQT